jgi:TolA-binding protein
MDLKDAGWPAAFLTLFGGGGVWAYLGARAGLRRSPPAAMATADAAVTEAAAAFMEKLGQSWSKHTDALRDEIRELRGQLGEQRGQIGELRGQLQTCEDHKDETNAELARLREEVFLLKHLEPPPAYLPGLEPKPR